MSKPATWKCNVRKKAHQSGKAYINRRGKSVSDKQIKTKKNFLMDCRYKCQENISCDERLAIHQSYYTLGSATEKRHFLLSNTMRTRTARPLNKAHESNDANIESTDQEDSSNDVSRPNTNEPKQGESTLSNTFFLSTEKKFRSVNFSS